jgi:hypothetical protein
LSFQSRLIRAATGLTANVKLTTSFLPTSRRATGEFRINWQPNVMSAAASSESLTITHGSRAIFVPILAGFLWLA